MELILCSLAVYKLVQIAEALSPREVMPWVKVLVASTVSYVIGAIAGVDNLWLSGLCIATLASTVHAVLRLLTLTGDMAYRKSIK